ncbi:MAG TPA: hypothetical protein VGD56_11950 [Gemmatirosa sp.]
MTPTPRRLSCDPQLCPAVLDPDPSDRMLRADACALLGVRVDTFRAQYCTPARRAASTAHFGIARDERRRVTLSRQRIVNHLAAITGAPFGGSYCPPGPWAERLRQAHAAAAAYDARLATRAAGDTPPRGILPTDPQHDLFAA